MSSEACCTCAALLSSIPLSYDEKTEKPAQHERRLECCGRAICARCITDKPRFASYCPFCQISSTPSVLPQGLRDPPAYSPPSSRPQLDSATTSGGNDELPPYSARNPLETPPEKPGDELPTPDVLHFVDPNQDSVTSLSLRYGVPANALRKINSLYADHLLLARRTVLIPGEHYKGGVSLSPRPVQGEEEEIRKGKIRKFMVACKVSEYNIALLYLKQTNYDWEAAVEAYREDERWEREHPLEAAKKGGGKQAASRRGGGFGGSMSGPLS